MNDNVVVLSNYKPLVEAYTITPVSCRIRQWFRAVQIKRVRLRYWYYLHCLRASAFKHSNAKTAKQLIAEAELIKVEKNKAVGRSFSVIVCVNRLKANESDHKTAEATKSV